MKKFDFALRNSLDDWFSNYIWYAYNEGESVPFTKYVTIQ